MEKKNKTRLARASMMLLAMLCFLGGARAQVAVPYTEGFEDMNSADDLTAAGWISYGSQNGCILKIETSASNVHSGSKALDIDSWDASSSSAYQIVGLPVLDEPINGLQITFSYKVSTGTVDIGYLIDVNDATTFVSLKQFNNSSSYKTETVELNEAPATAARIAIKYSNYYRCYIDDIEVKDIPAFLKPTNLKVTSITSTSATLSWDSSGSGISYAYQYQEAGASDWSAETIINTTSVSLNELTPGTAYNFQVKVKSGSDESDWATIIFTTPCVSLSLTDVPYTENFDSYTAGTGVLPDCWNRINTCSNSSFSSYPYIYYGSSYATSGSNSLRFYSYYSSYTNYDPQNQYAILPPMENLAGKQITLQAKGYDTNSTFKIGTMTNPTDVSTFTEISTQSLTTSYQEFEYNIPSDATASYVAIMIEAATAERTTNCVYIDDIVIREAPSCLKPTDLNSTNITENSAELSWTAGGSETEWTIYYKKTTDENYIEVTDVTENPYTLEGLNAATTYQFYVVANCSDTDTSDPSSVYSFTTDCRAIASLPWTENFNSYTGSTSSSVPSGYPNDEMPICWIFLNRSETSSTYPLVFISSNSGYPVSGNCLFFRSSKDTPLYAVLPTFAEDISDLQLTFTYRNEGTSDSNGTLIVGYMTDPTEATTFTEVQTCDRTTTLTEKEVMFTNAPTGSYIAFMYQGGTSNNYYMSIDNVKVNYIPTCIKPTSLTTSNVTAHEATISWTSEADAWQIQVGDEEPINVITNPYTLTGLAAETAYSVKVRTNCGGTYSDWTNPVSFTTTVACPAPTNLAATLTPGDGTVANLSWTEPGDATNWVLEYGTASDFTGATSVNVSDNPSTNLTGLTPETTYYARVKAVCGGEDGESAWSNTVSFHVGYCTPNPTSHDGSGITGVSFGTGDYVVWNGDGSASLPASAPYYGDYTSMIGAAHAGVESTIAITTNTGNYPYTFVIWVDLDNSLSFEDNEILYIGKATTGMGTHNATITIPATQATGDYRMRIYGADSYFSSFYNNGNTNWEADHDPCSSGSYRHAHDYTLRVLEAPSCLPAGNVTVAPESITSTSAVISWTNYNGDEATYTVMQGENVLTTTAVDSYTLSGLTFATNYPAGTFTIISNCDETMIANVPAFTTPCDVITVAQGSAYTYDFEDETPLSCWTNVAGTNNRSSGSNHTDGGIYKLQFQGTTTGNIVAMPAFTPDINGLVLTFWTRPEDYSYSYCGTFSVGYMTDLDDASTFVAVDTYSYNDWTENEFVKKTAIFTNAPAGAYIAFRHNAGSQYYYWFVDDVEVSLVSLLPAFDLSDSENNDQTISDKVDVLANIKLANRTLFKDGTWNTFCVPFDVALANSPLAGAKVMELDVAGTYDGHKTGREEGTDNYYLFFKDASSIKAGKPYFVKWTTTGDDIVGPEFKGVTITTTTPTDIEATGITMKGNFSPVQVTANDMTTYFLMGDNKLYYTTVDRMLYNFRAYFKLDDASSAPNFTLGFDEGGTTRIFSIGKPQIEEGAWYDLNGRKYTEKPTAKGLYIHNGVKVIVK